MSMSNLKPVSCPLPPVAGENGTHSKQSKVKMVNTQAFPLLQVKEKEKHPCTTSTTTTTTTSRRDLTAASLGLLSLLLPAPAEARARNATMRQKIMDKFEEIRRKAGLSKDETKLKDDDENKNPHPHLKKTIVPPIEKEPSFPKLPNILNGKTVETTLP
ncbi:hypothetical protein ACJIZ3_019604 [Penstemon smallii]|uniref:Uncharacterized protein n=1 Tax=Penstemon smallii TaxID=265156 RepID=A0ABD3T1S7_9LAMI